MNSFLKQCIERGLPVILDYDGVLFEARFAEFKINAIMDEPKLIQAHREGQSLDTTPIRFMQDFVSSLTNPVFVLSHIHDDIEEENKRNLLDKYYSGLVLIRAYSTDDKIQHLLEIATEYGGFIYIDDTLPYIAHFEEVLGDHPNCYFFHVSSLYV